MKELEAYIPHSRYIYPTPDIIYPAPDIPAPDGVGYNILSGVYLEWGIYIWGIYISGAGYIYLERGILYLEWGIYIWSGVYYIWSGVYISGVGFIYLEQMTDFETYGTP